MQVIYLILGVSTTSVIAATVYLCTTSAKLAAISGVSYALLPSSVIYAFWPFSTQLTVTGVALAVWGVALIRSRVLLGSAISAVSLVLLFASRATFSWLFVILWVALIIFLIFRTTNQRKTRISGLVIMLLASTAVGALQIHYWTSFGLATTSSWTGENVIGALQRSGNLSISSSAIEEASSVGPCEGSLVRALSQQDTALSWQPDKVAELPGCEYLSSPEPTGVAALDQVDKETNLGEKQSDANEFGGSDINFNSAQRLETSRIFNTVMPIIISDQPLQVLSMALGGGKGSSLAIYIAPSEDFYFVDPIRFVHPLWLPGGVLSLFFAPAMMVLGGIGLVLQPLQRSTRNSRTTVVLATSWVLIGYHMATSTLLEFGENNRFQAEVAPALLVVGVLGLSAALRARRRDRVFSAAKES